MSNKTVQRSMIKDHRILWSLGLIIFFLVELFIFFMCVHHSGFSSHLQILDRNSEVVYETDGNRLSDFDKYYFEKAFGPIENYRLKLKTQNIPFPFRAWIVAAIGVPIGITLLLAFIYKSFDKLIYGKKDRENASDPSQDFSQENIHFFEGIRRTNIFVLGMVVFTIMIIYWILPNMITDVGQSLLKAIRTYPWPFAVAALLMLGVFVWIIYLRYLLAQKTIDSHMELKRYQLQLTYTNEVSSTKQIEFENNDLDNKP